MKAFVDEALEGEAQDVTDGFDESNQLRIVVMGAGGGGGNTVNRLSRIGIIGAELAACNTDAQDLRKIDQGITKILIGSKLTKGLGAGGFPEIGMKSAEASSNEIRNYLGRNPPDIPMRRNGRRNRNRSSTSHSGNRKRRGRNSSCHSNIPL